MYNVLLFNIVFLSLLTQIINFTLINLGFSKWKIYQLIAGGAKERRNDQNHYDSTFRKHGSLLKILSLLNRTNRQTLQYLEASTSLSVHFHEYSDWILFSIRCNWGIVLLQMSHQISHKKDKFSSWVFALKPNIVFHPHLVQNQFLFLHFSTI